MVGNGELMPATKKLAQELHVMDQIVFSDFRSDIPAILNAIDIYCLPSLWEGMPIGMLEAMAMGKACVATGVDGTAELVNDRKNGILIKTGDAESLAKQIIHLHLNPEEKNELGNQARKYITDHFSLSEMTHKIENLYTQTLLSNQTI